ncbi:MAG: hypothetical protein FWG87_11175 [Defluviitaleaceae bacterium]|nr:hypothetical protein [Defluviitaleaceae bacterium]
MKTPPTLALLLLIAILLSSCLSRKAPTTQPTSLTHPTPPTNLDYSTPTALSIPEETPTPTPAPTPSATHFELYGILDIPEETPTPTPNPWTEPYRTILTDYEKTGSQLYFILFDLDKSGTPELLVVGEHADNIYEAAYAFRNGGVTPLALGEGVFLAHSALSARAGVEPANDMPGLITYMIGPSAGSFGTSTAYTLITVDEDMLVIAFTGCNYVDVEALHELFDNFPCTFCPFGEGGRKTCQ